MARRSRRRKVLVFTLAILAALLAAGGVSGYTFLTKNDPVIYSNIVEQYKYGSFGSEQLQGVPYEIWVVLPEVFPDLLPKAPGKGWEKIGFIYENGPRDADRHDVPRQADRPRRAQLRGLPRGHVPGEAGRAGHVVLGMPCQPDADRGLHRLPAESRARQAVQRRHAARRDQPPLPRQALVPGASCSTATSVIPEMKDALDEARPSTSRGSTAAPSTGPGGSTRSIR